MEKHVNGCEGPICPDAAYNLSCNCKWQHMRMGTIVCELYWKHSPNTCRNFAELARRGYYNGIKFHRIIRDFMIQGGDPTGTGRGGASIYGKQFEDEITSELKHTGLPELDTDEAASSFATFSPVSVLDVGKIVSSASCAQDPIPTWNLKHCKDELLTTITDIVNRSLSSGAGILSMANNGPDTNGSQFFLTLAPTQWLDGKHTIFGRVSGGMNVVSRIGMVETDNDDQPTEDIKILKAYITPT
ncbi:hypothetical protein LSH36_178g06003 [Paralvinella palmiformis]|uniref:Peptidyl-prolyl cis-trans isomerase n=1 Tax=Paralvinella palmiformis TaxID=53620 RepID=A0AAD9N793_9ANNE|nr:hypothetical protein LSH36_178g06003 [Paralvinella palmiformis]